ncbi:AAA family ATPase [Campylobacter sp.]|uniref:AAA family ATPase n=1 Tax=Campylobacter sp. TaxID=205 RepID=UPI003F9F33C2
MIASFEVCGYASISQNIKIDFTAKQNQRLKNTKYESNYFSDTRLAKSAVLFGKNATGKTNILKALESILRIIENGLNIEKESQFINSDIGYTEYKITITDNKKDSYVYEIKFDKERIISENLTKNEVLIYRFNKDSLTFPIATEYEKILSVVSRDTVLNKIKDNNVKELRGFQGAVKVYGYNKNINTFDIMASQDRVIPFDLFDKDFFTEHKDTVLNILEIVDDSITDFDFIDIKDDRFSLILKRDHKSFAFEKESSGVKKIIELMVGLVYAIDSADSVPESVMIIDELDSSISTISLIRLLNGVINSSSNTKGQFILSSHNPLIFDTDMLAPSQIYIVGKENTATMLKALSEFELRNDKKKAYMDYLRGDYE